MKVVVLSDTHGYKPVLPEGDILIHCGDATARGTEEQHYDFVRWLDSQPHSRKVFVAGNHCLFSESCYIDNEEHRIFPTNMPMIPRRPKYLRDSIYVHKSGLKIYGTPWTPNFNQWAFMYNNPSQGHEHFSKIPEGVDVLICHGPPFGILDTCLSHDTGKMKHAGSKELLYHINRVKPKVVVFGHLHLNGGKQVQKDGILYINAAVCNEAYEPLNPIQTFEI